MGIFDELSKKIDHLNREIQSSGNGGEGLPVETGTGKYVGRKAFITDPFLEVNSSQGSYRAKQTRLSNRLLRGASIEDPIMSAILRHRRTQIEAFCNVPHTRFDTGFTWIRRDGKELHEADYAHISKMSTFMYHCGLIESTPPDDRSTMAVQFGMLVQDALTFGHIAIEKVRDRVGGLQRIRHVAGESVFHVGALSDQDLKSLTESQLQAINLARQGLVTEDKGRIKYLQIVDAKEITKFSDETMIFRQYQPPSFVDNNGYSTSLVEACIKSITRHLQAENYNALFFTHGFAARGLLHLKGNVSQQNLQLFRNQFNAAINGNNNSWRTPIVGGLDDVQWIPLAGTSRDMEYIQYTDHLIRTICAQAQIDPTEIGFEYLGRGTQQATLNSPNNEWKITASQERGLVPLLRFLEDLVNHDIMPEIDPSLAEEYLFKFIGLNSENRQQEITRMQAEMSVHASLNDLLHQVKKKPLDKDTCGDIPLNTLWWNVVKECLTVGEIREKFCGDEDASKRKELQYIPSPMFMQWQQLLQAKTTQEAQMKQQQDQSNTEQQQNNMQGGNLNLPAGPNPNSPNQVK